MGAGAWRRRNGGLPLVQCPSMVYGRVSPACRGARARRKRPCWASSPERASAVSASALHAQATTRSEREGWHVGAGAWRRRNGGLSLVQCPSMVYGPSVASAGAARARVGSARAGPRPQRERAQWRASALHAQATTRSEREGWHVGAGAWRRRNGGLSLVQCPSIVYGPSVASAGAARARSEAPVLGLVPRESERSGAQARYTRKPPRAVRGRAGTWEQGPGAEGTAASRSCSALPWCMAECRQRWRGARARRKRPCWASSPERASAVSASALHAQATTRSEREGWHVGAGAWRRRNGGLSLVQCPSIVVWTECRQRLARRARASEAHVLGLVPRESERSGAQARYTRKPPRAVRGRAGTWEQGPGAEGTAASRSCSALPWCMDRVSPARRGARASEAHVLGLVPRESERSGAQARYTRKPPRAVRGRAGTWEQGPGAEGTAASRSCSALPWCMDRVSPAWRGARARRKRPCWASSPERASAVRASALHAQATSRSEREGWHVGAGAWRRRNGGLSLVQCPSIVYGPSGAGLARRARASEAHVLGLVPRESERSGAQARYTRKPPRAVRGRAGTWEQGPGAEGTAASRSCSALPWCMDRVSPARRGARASEAPVLGLVPRESERSGAQARYTRKPPRAVRGRAGTWEQGPGAEGTAASRSCSALPWCMDRVSPAWRGARARRKRPCWASSPERASAVARKRATRASHHAQ